MKRILSFALLYLQLCVSCNPSAYGAGPLIWGANSAAQNLAPGGIYLPNQQPVLFGEQTGNGVNYIGIEAPNAVTANTTFKLPDGDGGTGQLLSTNGSGSLAWVSPGSATVNASAGTSGVTLTTSSLDVQVFTPSTAITVKLDNSFTAGRVISIVNAGTNEITLTANDNSTIRTVYRTTTAQVMAKSTTPTTNTSWIGLNSVVSPPIATTLTVNAFSTLTNPQMFIERKGKRMIVTGAFRGDTVQNTTSYIQLPSGTTIDYTATYNAVANNGYAGEWNLQASGASSNIYVGGNAGKFFTDGSTSNQIFFANSVGSNGYEKKSANAIWASTTYISFKFEVYITEWSEFSG
jgi:hypothetical protein